MMRAWLQISIYIQLFDENYEVDLVFKIRYLGFSQK